jgi:hypothetical protein
MKLAHKEILADVFGTVNFYVDSYGVNPGRTSVFPWGAKIAKCFEEYRFDYLRFRFLSNCTTSVKGTLFMAFCYDPSNDDPVTKQELANIIPQTYGQVWTNQVLEVPVTRLNQALHYIRIGDTVTDFKEYDIGNFYIATIGQADTSIIGTVQVEYSVTLIRPTSNHEDTADQLLYDTSPAKLPRTILITDDVNPNYLIKTAPNRILTSLTETYAGKMLSTWGLPIGAYLIQFAQYYYDLQAYPKLVSREYLKTVYDSGTSDVPSPSDYEEDGNLIRLVWFASGI